MIIGKMDFRNLKLLFAALRVETELVIAFFYLLVSLLRLTSAIFSAVALDLIVPNIFHKENTTPDKIRIDCHLSSILTFKVEDIIGAIPSTFAGPRIMNSHGQGSDFQTKISLSL